MQVNPGMVVQAFNPSIQEKEVSAALLSKPGLHNELQDGQSYIVRRWLTIKGEGEMYGLFG